MTAPKDAATPRPWAAQTARTMIHIAGSNGEPVLSISFAPARVPEREMRGRKTEAAHANADLLLRAVNSHDALVDALRIAEVIADRSVKDGKAPEGALRTIRAALALAGVES